MILLSITGLFRTVLIIFGVLFLLSLLGKVAQARRNMADEKRMRQEDERARNLKDQVRQNYGKTTISKIDKKNIPDSEYTDFEEVD
ncbi:MAG: hypothetical protein HUJ25_09820 [Crocinitomicaceae bacterium]|nr:hypothetical protein [Crocinitomicaceae bacterium]